MIRNGEEVLKQLKHLSNGSSIALSPLTIQFPVRFQDIKLAIIGEKSYVYGLFALISGERYAVVNVNCYVELSKAKIDKVTIGGVEYYNLNYEAGDVVYLTDVLVSRTNLVFTALDEFIFKGKMPWYIDYQTAGTLFKTVNSYAGSKAKIPPAMMQFFAGYVGRFRKDRTKYIREVAKDRKDFTLENIAWVPFRSIFWSTPGTVNRLSGAYANDGIVNALVNPSNRVETVERILRE